MSFRKISAIGVALVFLAFFITILSCNMMECRYCDGLGICANCDGTGVVPDVDNPDRNMTCDHCSGTLECNNCGGDGRSPLY